MQPPVDQTTRQWFFRGASRYAALSPDSEGLSEQATWGRVRTGLRTRERGCEFQVHYGLGTFGRGQMDS